MFGAKLKRVMIVLSCAVLSGVLVGFAYYELTYLHFGGSFIRAVLLPGVAVGCFTGMLSNWYCTRRAGREESGEGVGQGEY